MENSYRNAAGWLTALGALALLGGAAAYYSGQDISPIKTVWAAEGRAIPAPSAKFTEPAGQQVAVFAGGCFWGVEGVFERVSGVLRVESGYAGGAKSDATYDRVSEGLTRHAESVRIVYDPAKVSYATLLHIFFSVAHDPTQLNRQGPDHGPQYRSAIFPSNDEQKGAALAYIAQLNAAKIWSSPIVTRIESGPFFAAEDYHQDYMVKNPNSGYILRYDVPKVEALKRLFPEISS